MTAQPARIETDAERAFREGAETLIARAPPGEAQTRRAALEAFLAQGLPDRRREEFHFTDLRAKLRDAYPPSLAGSSVLRLAPREPEPSWPTDSLDALNRALTMDGESLLVAAGETKEIVWEGGAVCARMSAHPRRVVSVGRNARLTLIERTMPSAEDHLRNAQTAIEIGEGAEVEHIKLLAEGDAAHLAGVRVTLAARARYRATTLALETRLARHAVWLRFAGAGAQAEIRSVALVRGEEHVDFNVRADHEATNCVSEQEMRLVAIGSARGVAQGLVRVAPSARGSDARQMIRGLILSPKAEIDAKPELEILNDDVKASHGTAIGDLDPEAIFYLRSRGVPGGAARALLAEAFIAEVLDGIADEGARARLKEAAGAWLARALGGEDG